jgi:hypothetical protein
MRGERQLLRFGEYLLGRASRPLPRRLREERYREWAAELPVILHDPQVRLAPRRAVRMLSFAADTFRGTALTLTRRRSTAMTRVIRLLLIAQLAAVTSNIWIIALAPRHLLSYLQLAWSLLLVVSLFGMLAHSHSQLTRLVIIGGLLLGVAVDLCQAVQDRGDWVSYMLAALLVLALVAWWPASRWVTKRRHAAGKQA